MTKLYLQLYETDSYGNKCAMQTIAVEHKIDELHHHKLVLQYTASGYGRKIPTRYKVKYNNRWYRVYICIYSNSGTSYITVKGNNYVVSKG